MDERFGLVLGIIVTTVHMIVAQGFHAALVPEQEEEKLSSLFSTEGLDNKMRRCLQFVLV